MRLEASTVCNRVDRGIKKANKLNWCRKRPTLLTEAFEEIEEGSPLILAIKAAECPRRACQ
jgi:hypothetical protein